MRHRMLALPSALLFISLFSSLTVAATHEDMVARYMALSGINAMLKSIPGHIDAAASHSNLISKHPEVDRWVHLLMKESFDLQQAKKNLSVYLFENTDEPYLREMVRWLETPLARKITREEALASGAEKQADMLRHLADLQARPPTEQRIALIQRLEGATHASELASNILSGILKGMIASASLALPEGEREAAGEAYEEIGRIMPLVQEAARQRFILASFYVYRNIPDQELSAYASFYESALGQKEIRTTGEALSYALARWLEDFGNLIISATQDTRKSKQ